MSDPTELSKDGWTELHTVALPRPTWSPAALALGTTLALWGFVTSPIVMALGVALFAASIGYWIAEIRHERPTERTDHE